MQDLIERLENATEPDRGLDLEIAIAAHGRPGVLVAVQDEAGNIHEHTYWEYTASIDDALTLAPDGWLWYVADSDDRSNGSPVASVFRTEDFLGTGAIPRSVGHNPAIALCIAALKARAGLQRQAAA